MSFQETSFYAASSPGAVGTQCTETSQDLDPSVRFTLSDSETRPIVPGTTLGDFEVALNTTFRSSDVSVFGNQARAFPTPDVVCDAGSEGTPCPVAELADAGFSCGPLVAGDDELACVRDMSLQVSPNADLEFDSGRRAAVVILMSHGASMLGWTQDDNVSRACSADPSDRRRNALIRMMRQIEQGPNADTTEVCLATFTNATEPQFLREDGETLDTCFRRVGAAGATWEDDFTRLANQEEGGAGRNPWAAVKFAADRLAEYYGDDTDRHVILLTDGDIDERSVDAAVAQNLTADAALQAAVNGDVAVHIAHLDPERGENCFPANVRGANDDLARLACATGGNYNIVAEPSDLAALLEAIGRAVSGHFRVRMLAGDLAVFPLGPYRLEFTMNVELDTVTKSIVFSARGADDGDTRLTLFNRGTCSAGAPACYSGFECRVDDVCEPARPEIE